MNMALTARLFLSVSSITFRVMRPLYQATSGGRERTDGGGLHHAGDAHHEQAGHREDDEQRQDAGPEQPDFFTAR